MSTPEDILAGFTKSISPKKEVKTHYLDMTLKDFLIAHEVDRDLKEFSTIQKFFKDLQISYDNILFAMSTYPEEHLNFSVLEEQMDYFLETDPTILKYIEYRTKAVHTVFKNLFTQQVLTGLKNKTSELNSDNEEIHKHRLLERSLINLKNT